jgi:glycosyltransferase involved in cell wall biosynthesis
MSTQIYTSIAANYIPKARVLAQSVKKFHPEFSFHVVLCDAVPSWFSIENEPFDSLIPLWDLDQKISEEWIFKHTLVELSTGVKGFALKKLLDLPGCTNVVYLDPDIVVLSPLDSLLGEFANGSILLTPHIAEPETTTEAILDNEFSVLQHGIYNLGFLGVKNSPEGRRFATWWSERLDHFCYDDIPRGIFTDQRWADLIPAYFSDHKVLREAIYNVCTWNLTHRTVTGSMGDGLLVNGRHIVFYHFSGFDSGAQQAMLDKYGQTMPALYELREWYIAECERMGQSDLDNTPWSYGFFENGERILNAHRKRYRERVDLQKAFPNPFQTSAVNRSYLHWFNLNDESRVPLQNTPEDSEPLVTPDYRVFVIAAPSDSPYVQESLDCIAKRTVSRNELFLVMSLGAEPLFSPDGVQVISFEANSYNDLFAAVLERFCDKDLILIRAGAVPPEKWDLRLAWSAARQMGVATVSAVDARHLDRTGMLTPSDDFLLDRLCYLYRGSTDLEIASFSQDCVYIRAAALRDISACQKHAYPADLTDGAARLRYSHLLASHVCVAWRRPRDRNDAIVVDSATSWSLEHLRERVRGHLHIERDSLPSPVKAMTRANLHIMHSWGGGLERWVLDYCRADREHENLVLKSVGTWGAFGSELHLYRHVDDANPLNVWPLAPAIKATATSHAEYADALRQILDEYSIGQIIVSSLIGHSLDSLRQHTPTLLVCHDYHPFCPAINITFDTVCQSCQEPRLADCTRDNPLNQHFRNVPTTEWVRLRKEFTAAVKDCKITLIAPSPSVRDNYSRLLPDLADSFRVIPHGTPVLQSVPVNFQFEQDRNLRVLILGRLAPHKGGLLLERLLPELLPFADLTLAGCGAQGQQYAENPAIRVIPEYERQKLPELIGELKPDLGLLLSVVPETFSYTLAELQALRVPVLATRIGSFADRIEDGVTGFLCALDPQAIVQRLKSLAADRRVLRQVHENLKSLKVYSVEDMLKDYAQLNPTRYSARSYFDGPRVLEHWWRKSVRLYWRTAESNFRDEDSVAVSPLGCDRQTIRLHFPRQEDPLEEMRLDPASQAGFSLLHRLSLRDHQDRVIWEWSGDTSLLKSVVRNQILFIDSCHPNSEGLLYFTGDDPYLVLPIARQLLAQVTDAGYLEVDFSLTTAEEHMEALTSFIEVSSAGQFRAEAEAEQLHTEIRGRNLWVQHLESAVADRDSKIQRLDNAVADRDSKIQRLDSAVTYYDSLLQQLRDSVGEHDSLIQQLQNGIREKDLHVQRLESALAAVQSSISWRVTGPARTFAAIARKGMK